MKDNMQINSGSGRDCWRFDGDKWEKVMSTQDEHFAAGMAATSWALNFSFLKIYRHLTIPWQRGTVVIFGGSSNSDGSTELFDESDGETSWSTVSYHEKLANRYRFGTVSIDDEVYAFGKRKWPARFLFQVVQLSNRTCWRWADLIYGQYFLKYWEPAGTDSEVS